MRRLPGVLALAILLMLAVVLPLALTGGGHHAKRTPEQLNGHQTERQKQAKGVQSRRELKAIATSRNPAFRAKVCDQLPEGYGHMGVCAAAPAYLKKSVAPNQVFSGQLGIDTSHWDHCGVYLAGPRFWIVALGDGSYVDPCAGPLYHALRAAGVTRAVYMFTRQYLDPTASADHTAQLIHQMGATDSTVPWDDAEAISSCSWVYTYDARLARDLGIDHVGDYSSPGLWSGCSGRGKPAWTAAYGPLGQRLSGGFAVYALQQFTDGHVGPGPHCLAVCGDVDIATANLATIALGPPPPAPATNTQTAQCGLLRYWRSHGFGNRPDTGDLRNSLVANFVACPDHTAVHYKVGPNPPQPSPAEFRMCRELNWWRSHGRPADQRAHETADRNRLVGLHDRCNGRPPLIAVHG